MKAVPLNLIEFDLVHRHDERGKPPTIYERVVCFSNKPVCAVSVKMPDDKMSHTWLDGYKWKDLNILCEAYINRDGSVDLARLRTFINAFFENRTGEVWMTIWNDALPKETKPQSK